jgi:hypothetical protein
LKNQRRNRKGAVENARDALNFEIPAKNAKVCDSFWISAWNSEKCGIFRGFRVRALISGEKSLVPPRNAEGSVKIRNSSDHWQSAQKNPYRRTECVESRENSKIAVRPGPVRLPINSDGQRNQDAGSTVAEGAKFQRLREKLSTGRTSCGLSESDSGCIPELPRTHLHPCVHVFLTTDPPSSPCVDSNDIDTTVGAVKRKYAHWRSSLAGGKQLGFKGDAFSSDAFKEGMQLPARLGDPPYEWERKSNDG